MPRGMKLWIAAKDERWVLEGQGFQPGERVSIDDWCEGHHVGGTFAPFSPPKSAKIQVDEQGRFSYQDWALVFPLQVISPEHGLACQVYVANTRGMACLTVQMTMKIEQLR